MIYTTYFAKLNKLPDSIIPVSICRITPDWYHGARYKKLAPGGDMLYEFKKTGDIDLYKRRYIINILNNLSLNQVIRDLYSIAEIDNGDRRCDIALVCYEKPSDFCHRHVVAEWFRNGGHECVELDI